MKLTGLEREGGLFMGHYSGGSAEIHRKNLLTEQPLIIHSKSLVSLQESQKLNGSPIRGSQQAMKKISQT